MEWWINIDSLVTITFINRWTAYSNRIDSPIVRTNSCDRALLLEVVTSPIDKQNCCDREPLAELVASPIIQHWNLLRLGALNIVHWLPDRPTKILLSVLSYQSSLTSGSIDKVLVIGSSHQSSLTPRSTDKLLAIGSSYQSSLTPKLTDKLLVIGSPHQSLLTPPSSK